MVEWKAKINTFDRTLEVYMYDEKNPVEFLAPKSGNHMKLHLGRLNQVSSETKKKIEDELVQEQAEIVEEEKSTDFEIIRAVAETEILTVCVSEAEPVD